MGKMTTSTLLLELIKHSFFLLHATFARGFHANSPRMEGGQKTENWMAKATQCVRNVTRISSWSFTSGPMSLLVRMWIHDAQVMFLNSNPLASVIKETAEGAGLSNVTISSAIAFFDARHNR